MISTGATVAAAIDALLAHGCKGDVTVAATHGLFAGEAVGRLSRPELMRTVTSDSLPLPLRVPERHALARLAPLLAEAIRRLSEARGLSDLLAVR